MFLTQNKSPILLTEAPHRKLRGVGKCWKGVETRCLEYDSTVLPLVYDLPIIYPPYVPIFFHSQNPFSERETIFIYMLCSY